MQRKMTMIRSSSNVLSFLVWSNFCGTLLSPCPCHAQCHCGLKSAEAIEYTVDMCTQISKIINVLYEHTTIKASDKQWSLTGFIPLPVMLAMQGRPNPLPAAT